MGRTTRKTTGTLTFSSDVEFNNEALKVNTTDLTTGDNIITLNKNQGSLSDAGLEVDKAGSIQASLIYNDSGTGTWRFTGASAIDMTGASLTNFSVTSLTNLNVTNFVSNNVDIGGGAIDGTTIGGTTPGAGSFTTLQASGGITGTLTGTASSIANHSTTNLAEGSNLYYTDTRWDSRLGTKTTDNLSEGSSNLYFTDARWDTRLGTKSTTNLAEGTNLYFTNARADARADVRIAASSINALSDVNTSGVATNHVLQWNGTAFVPASIGNSFSNIVTDKDNSTSAVTGATLQNEAASGLTATITPQDSSAKLLIQSNIKYSVQSSTGSTAFYIRLWRDKGAGSEKLLAEDVVYEATNTATTFQTNFSVFDAPGDTSAHTYAVYYDASTANGTLTPNPAHSEGTASENYITASESIITADLVTLTGSNTLTNKILTSPTITTPIINGTISGTAIKDEDNFASDSNQHLATQQSIKSYVDAQVQSKDTLGELTDVDTSGASNGKIIKYNGTTWVVADDTDTDTGILNVVEDTTPQLGGGLDLNSQNITGTGSINITGGITASTTGAFKDGTYSGNVTVSGNLTVEGDTTTIDVTQLEVEDPMIYLNRNAGSNSTNTYDSGILIERGSSEVHAGMIWQEATDRFKFLTSTGITPSTTVVPSITLADVQAATVHTNGILPSADATYDIGSSSLGYNMVYAKATSAQYADLAELYVSDAEYEPGTVVVFGGVEEVTQSTASLDHKIAGVVSTKPAYLMNDKQEGCTVAVALRGKVPVNVIGPVSKGDLIVSSDTPGVGKAHPGVTNCVYVIGKCIEDDDSENLVRLVNCVV